MKEIEFKNEIKHVLGKIGATITHIEPNIGSTPGVPDSLIQMGACEFWLELKVFDKLPTMGLVWNDLMRPAQRKWVKQRYNIYEMDGDQLVPYFVAVHTPFGIWLYRYSIFRKDLKVELEQAMLGDLINFFKGVCGV